jgi:hypothetical protein
LPRLKAVREELRHGQKTRTQVHDEGITVLFVALARAVRDHELRRLRKRNERVRITVLRGIFWREARAMAKV